MSGQFGTFDTKDDRRELFILIDRLGGGLPDPLDKERRAAWLQRLARKFAAKVAGHPIEVPPQRCTAVGAFDVFTHIVGVLGVDINVAARLLENEVRRR